MYLPVDWTGCLKVSGEAKGKVCKRAKWSIRPELILVSVAYEANIFTPPR